MDWPFCIVAGRTACLLLFAVDFRVSGRHVVDGRCNLKATVKFRAHILHIIKVMW